jgi:uncharacterized membrane protein YfcA
MMSRGNASVVAAARTADLPQLVGRPLGHAPALDPASNTAILARLGLVVLIAIAAVQHWSLFGEQLDRKVTLSGLLVGTLVGLTGMGSGALLAPILILVVGVPPVTAVGTDLAFASITKMFGGIEHVRQRTVNYRIAGLLALGSLPAGLLGVQLLEYLRRNYSVGTINAVVLRALGGVLILSALSIAYGLMRDRSSVAATRRANDTALRPGRVVALGAAVGLLVGLTSVGAGSIVVALLSLSSPLPAATIVGTDIVHAIALTSVTAFAHGIAGNIDVGLMMQLLSGSIPGVLLGSRLTTRVPASILRAVLAVVLLFTGLKLL